MYKESGTNLWCESIYLDNMFSKYFLVHYFLPIVNALNYLAWPCGRNYVASIHLLLCLNRGVTIVILYSAAS